MDVSNTELGHTEQMKSGMAMGTDDVTAELWKSKCWSPAECSNYRPARLLSHGMVFELVLNRRIRDIVSLSTNQCGFVARCGTTDAIYAACLLIEKHRGE
ncbi:hypothetical protein Y032_0002g906 [Ancylostoma ceylanicum]|uniref:Reverse transcriptase domain-containing protein n=1 Tax=Ancylostoma ceylanicum TaxID=53326 RepID=A0A016W1B7_9BILA|nr:hypothetical protein Y032_0002g906 [Ancylostoma ceylanicum]